MFYKVEDFVIENVNGWYGFNGKKIITNVPLVKKEEVPDLDNIEIGFGKFKGTKFKNLPNWYLNWVKDNVKKNQYNQSLFQYINIIFKK
jgi:uncharacterized protein (DUF3820 family)